MHLGEALTMQQLAEALAAWMEVMRLEQGALLGHSFGCQILAAPDPALSPPPQIAADVSGWAWM